MKSMTHIGRIDHIVNNGEDTEVPGEGSDGGGHSVRLAGSALDSHSAQLDQKKENRGSRDTRVGFGSPSEKGS